MAGNGSFQAWAFEGLDPKTREPFANYESVAGGLGATTFSDGMDAVRGWPLGSMNPPVEALEQDIPVIVRRYELAAGSGGEGRFRGGLGMRRDIEILGLDVRLSSYAMRQVVPPGGALGGAPGSKGRFILNPGTAEERQLPVVISNMPVPTGAIIRCETPGGGGLGPAAERERARRARDLAEGRMPAPEGAP
jgi:N-methylhydantoinase B